MKAEDGGYRHLEQLDRSELSAQQRQLAGHQQQVPEDSELPDGGLKPKAQHIGDAGDGGGAQACLGDTGYPQGVHKQPHGKKEISFDQFSFLHIQSSLSAYSIMGSLRLQTGKNGVIISDNL